MHFKNEDEVNTNSYNPASIPEKTSTTEESQTPSTSCSSSTDSGVVINDKQTTICSLADHSNGNKINNQLNTNDIGFVNVQKDLNNVTALHNNSNNDKDSPVSINNKSNNNAKDNNKNRKQITYINNISNESTGKLSNVNTYTDNTSSDSSFRSNNSEISLNVDSSSYSIHNIQSNSYSNNKSPKTNRSPIYGETLSIHEDDDANKRNINTENNVNITRNGSAACTVKINENLSSGSSCERLPHSPPSSPSETQKKKATGSNVYISMKADSKTYSPTLSVRSTSISIVSIDENAVDSSIIDSDSEQDADAEGVHSNYIVKKLGQQTTLSPESDVLSNLNKGLKVVGQTINPDGNKGLGPIAENVLNGGLCAPNYAGGGMLQPIGPPKIGSVALTNSTDVTFGDKHFYEGPVTIQQFLIDSRDKWKVNENEEGQDNPAFAHENGYSTTVNEPKSISLSGQDQRAQFIINNRKAVIGTGIVVLLTLLIGVIILSATNVLQTQNPEESEDISPVNGTLEILSKGDWKGRPPTATLDRLKLPVHRVIISHTATDTCQTKVTCSNRCRVIQAYHMDSLQWDDIGYNFLVGGDGNVYEGRGWNKQGAHTKGYNVDSIGISFIGTFNQIKPTDKQELAVRLLIEEGVAKKNLVPNYRLYGHRQLSGTESPGDVVFGIIKKWPHFSTDID